MQLIATHAGFHAFASQAEDGLEISYRDTEGRDIDKERFPGITDYRLKQEHIESQLKKFWGPQNRFHFIGTARSSATYRVRLSGGRTIS
jgi:hypothetical protein